MTLSGVSDRVDDNLGESDILFLDRLTLARLTPSDGPTAEVAPEEKLQLNLTAALPSTLLARYSGHFFEVPAEAPL